MSLTWVLLVHWLHVLAGLLWFGGYAFLALVVWPALLRRPAPEAHALFTALARPTGTFMAASAHVAFWLGLLRGTWLGPVKSFSALTGTPYGWTFGTALILTLAVMIYGAATGRKLEALVWEGDRFRPDAGRKLKRLYALPLGLLVLIVACMVLMRFGL